MSDAALAVRLEAALGHRPQRMAPLSGGCIADIRRVDFEDGGRVVAKFGGELETEAYMLRYLATHSDLPVPKVLHDEPDLLVIEFIEAGDPIDARAEVHAADLIAALHGITAPRFGHERDTLIGPLPQANKWADEWVVFFRDRRLLPMARTARDSGNLGWHLFARLERLAGRLDEWLVPTAAPALVHGDLWGGNVLVRDGRVAAFVDPAIYHADPEIELAFATLFNTFGGPFFDRYREHRPIADGFFEVRRDLYNLYPLLVHTHLFGDAYAGAVEEVLDKLGA